MEFRRICLVSFAVALVAHRSFAAETPPGTLLPAAPLDDDFFLQGEYTGTLASADGRREANGVQVVALGDGAFQAVEYAGGLPGNGGAAHARRTYRGQSIRAGQAELSGDGRRLTIGARTISVRDDSNKPLGTLRKTQRLSQTLSARPPTGAEILFFGRDARSFGEGRVTPDHLLVAGADTKEAFDDLTIHLEFRTPYMPRARGQARGNSGVYIQGRYELQVLDSFGLEGANNECGSLYKQRAPDVNLCFPPLAWQTYDIDFTAARFDAARKKTRNAQLTARLNGIVIHKNVELTGKTGGGAAEGPDARPLRLQDHGNPVHFRNIWIIRRNAAGGACDCR